MKKDNELSVYLDRNNVRWRLYEALLRERATALVNVGTVGHIDHGGMIRTTGGLMGIDAWGTNVPDYSPNIFFLDLPDPHDLPKLSLMEGEEYPSPYNIGPRSTNKGKKGKGRRKW